MTLKCLELHMLKSEVNEINVLKIKTNRKHKRLHLIKSDIDINFNHNVLPNVKDGFILNEKGIKAN